MFQISYFNMWRYVIKLFNLMFLSDRFWLAYIVDIQTWTNKIGSEQNANYLKTIYFKGWPSIGPHYAEAAFMDTILLFFSHINFTHEKMMHAFNLPWKFYNYWNVENLNKTTWKNFQIFSTQIISPKIRTKFVFWIS